VRRSKAAAAKPDPVEPAFTPAALAGEQELAIRSARKDGRQVVTLRCVEAHGEFIVDAEVYPVSGLRVDPLRPGPYRFPSLLQANAFVDEAMQALTFLGCETA
jgi:hypothetical protein